MVAIAIPVETMAVVTSITIIGISLRFGKSNSGKSSQLQNIFDSLNMNVGVIDIFARFQKFLDKC